MTSRKISIEVTEAQLYDLINCVRRGIDLKECYGHLTTSEINLAEANRKRLLWKLEKVVGLEPTEAERWKR